MLEGPDFQAIGASEVGEGGVASDGPNFTVAHYCRPHLKGVLVKFDQRAFLLKCNFFVCFVVV